MMMTQSHNTEVVSTFPESGHTRHGASLSTQHMLVGHPDAQQDVDGCFARAFSSSSLSEAPRRRGLALRRASLRDMAAS